MLIPRGYPCGVPNLARPVRWYDAQYRVRPQREDAWVHRRTQLIWGPALEMARKRVVDVGCGDGYVAQLAPDFGKEYVLGLDGSKVAIARARERCLEDLFLVGDVFEWPRRVNRPDYDTVLFLEVLEHIQSDLRLVATVPRRKHVVLSIPNFQCEGHCRWFGNVGEAYRRYRDFLDVEDMHVTHAGDHEWYLLSGVRR